VKAPREREERDRRASIKKKKKKMNSRVFSISLALPFLLDALPMGERPLEGRRKSLSMG